MSFSHQPPQGPFRSIRPLVLASASPRRQSLLATCGLFFQVLPSRTPEPGPEQGENPAAYAERMARLKAHEVSGRTAAGCILAADTIVVHGATVLGKPEHPDQALATLRRLSGQSHEVITGCCLIDLDQNRDRAFSVTTAVNMAGHSRQTLAAYVQTGEPMDKAGSYGIQGAGSFLVASISGSYTNVVGLPVQEIIQALLDWDVIRAG
jgi:septum formation protein